MQRQRWGRLVEWADRRKTDGSKPKQDPELLFLIVSRYRARKPRKPAEDRSVGPEMLNAIATFW